MELYEFYVLGCSLFSAGVGVGYKQLTKILNVRPIYVMFYVIVSCDVRSNGRTQ